jgi:hypothetical protein
VAESLLSAVASGASSTEWHVATGWSGESTVAGGWVCSTGRGVRYTEGNAAGVGGSGEEQ